MRLKSAAAKNYLQAMGLMSLLSMTLLLYRTFQTGTHRFWFIPENLALSWIGLGFSWLLVSGLKNKPWLSVQNVGLSVLWLFFLPNTWYVITDFLHVYPTGEISELFDILMIFSLVTTGFLLGMTSLYLIHRQILNRLDARRAYLIVELVLLFSAFAIYLGRVLRFGSWDVVTDPTGLVINVSDTVFDPLGHPHALDITGLFFVLLSVSYLVFYRLVSGLQNSG